MDLKKLVKEAQVEVSEARLALKDKKNNIAKACMLHLRDLISRSFEK